MDLMQQWCAKVGVTKPVNGSWLFAICNHYRVSIDGNVLYNLALYYKVNKKDILKGKPILQAIAEKLGAMQPSNGSWLQAIIDL